MCRDVSLRGGGVLRKMRPSTCIFRIFLTNLFQLFLHSKLIQQYLIQQSRLIASVISSGGGGGGERHS